MKAYLKNDPSFKVSAPLPEGRGYLLAEELVERHYRKFPQLYRHGHMVDVIVLYNRSKVEHPYRIRVTLKASFSAILKPE